MTIRDRVLAAGYVRQSIDRARLIADLRQQPGCEIFHHDTISRIIDGKTPGRPAIILGLARVLGCDVEDLIDTHS